MIEYLRKRIKCWWKYEMSETLYFVGQVFLGVIEASAILFIFFLAIAGILRLGELAYSLICTLI